MFEAVSSPKELRRLEAVYETRLLDTEPEEPFDRLTALAASILKVPFAQVTVVDDKRSYWKSCFGMVTNDLAARSDPIERSFCQYVLAKGSEVILSNVLDDHHARTNPWVEQGVRSWAGFPLLAANGEIVGTFCVIDTIVRHWTDAEIQALKTLAHAASGEIQLRVTAEAARKFSDSLQNSLHPTTLPSVEGFDVVGHHIPARGEAGLLGDFYDVFQSPLGTWNVSIGDVSGHGIDAARLTALARWTIQSAATFTSDPVTILKTLHGVLLRHDLDRFVTAQMLTWDPSSNGTMVAKLALAGHPGALIRRSDGSVERCRDGGRVLGMVDPPIVASVALRLLHGDLLILATDGLFEARRNGEELGIARVENLLKASQGSGASQVALELIDLAMSWSGGPPHDDVAIVIVGPNSPRVNNRAE
jgi:phosphoserine phosphatase RsbU/P